MLPEIEQCTICVNLGLGFFCEGLLPVPAIVCFLILEVVLMERLYVKEEVQACNLFFSLRPCIWLASGFIHESSMDGLIIGSTA